MTLDDYKAMIEGASVYDVAEVSPLELAENLSQRLDNRVMMKREDLQPVFSFKLRGAYNKIAALPESAIARGVICSSAGNHAQGVSLAASRKGVRAVIVDKDKNPKWAPPELADVTTQHVDQFFAPFGEGEVTELVLA